MTAEDDDLACDYVLDRLDPAARAAFETRLLVEAELRQRVRDYETGLAARISELRAAAPSDAVWTRIASQVQAETPKRAVRWAPIFKWGIAAVIALSLASLAVERWVDRPYLVVVALGSGSSEPNRVTVARTGSGTNEAFIQMASLAASYWENAHPPGKAFVVYDPASSQGFIAVRDLPAAGADSHYQVWIIDRSSGEIRQAGALPAAGLYSFAVEPLPGEAADHLRVLVTRESGKFPAARPGPDVVLGG